MVRRHKQSGFTLIELMVVVGIIALLLSILLPSLSQARRNAQTTLCLNLLRGFGTSIAAYAETNNEYLPPLLSPTSNALREKLFDMDPTLEGIGGLNGEDYVGFMDILILSGFVDNVQTGACPNDATTLSPNANLDNANRARLSYGPNWFLYAQHRPGWGGSQTAWQPGDDINTGNSGPGNYGPKRTDIVSPANTIFIGDQVKEDGVQARAAVSWGFPEAGVFDFKRHDGNANAVYFDGHAASRSTADIWKMPYTGPDSTSLMAEAITNRGWPGSAAPSQPGGLDGADHAAYIFPGFAGWRSQPFQQDR